MALICRCHTWDSLNVSRLLLSLVPETNERRRRVKFRLYLGHVNFLIMFWVLIQLKSLHFLHYGCYAVPILYIYTWDSLGHRSGICEHLSPTHDLSQALTAGLRAKLNIICGRNVLQYKTIRSIFRGEKVGNCAIRIPFRANLSTLSVATDDYVRR